MVTMETVSPMRLAGLREHAPNITFGGPWKQIHAVTGAQGLIRPDSAFLAAFQATALNGPQGMTFYAACMRLADGQVAAAPLETLDVTGGRYACYVHRGAYDGLPGAWGAFIGEMQAAGHTPDLSRLCLETYVNDPRSTPVAELITELRVPIA